MKNLYIHIGYHKTATTSIQQFLHENDQLLRTLGVHYLQTGRIGASHGNLANLLKPESINSAESKKLWHSVFEEIQSVKSPNCLISSECFVESKVIPKSLEARLAGAFNVKIICFLRPQLDWLESVFNEIIKDDYRRYTGDVYSMREVEGGWINYWDILNLWAEQFGNENIMIRPFERRPDKKTDIYEDFLSLMNLGNIDKAVKPRSLNASIHPSYMEFLRRCNALPMLNPVHRQLVESIKEICARGTVAVPDIPRHASRMTESQQAEIGKKLRDGNSTLPKIFDAGGIDPFFLQENQVTRPFLAPEALLPVELEHALFSELPEAVSSTLDSIHPPLLDRKPGARFLPLPSSDMLTRLNSIIIRQRIEARMLYEPLENRNRSIGQFFSQFKRS